MENTSDYHNFIDVNDFIDNAPDDMIGTWEFHPHKTERFDLKCIIHELPGPGSNKKEYSKTYESKMNIFLMRIRPTILIYI